MTPEQKGGLPEWAQRERQRDLEWIVENLHVFWAFALAAFQKEGQGAIVVKTMSQPVKGKGNPMAYFPQEVIETGDDADMMRMVKGYNPDSEFVLVLIKAEDRMSTYRVQAQTRAKGE